uniref:probable receptor-like protein kinase At5g38990 n=1 Tax=Erigeron canadensis TaxID=72917 RepID=UPI001CB8FBFF|nr:probable receptor-like protein kinase At5g38990 [Erigeron canadensis]XP_043635304.1 probable receptor-like protein kinase At5g38990 [Erigeron canadensis]
MFPDCGNGKGSEEATSTAGLSQRCCQVKYDEILLATYNFDESLVVGKGGFGKVYKGKISIGTAHVDVAIKRLDLMSNQGATEFWAEVEMLSKLRHVHLVSLIGYCNYEKEMILVYEYMPHGTLEDHLHELHTPLSWIDRLKICIGAARGLDYLHTGTGIEVGVIHRDVKTSNILLHESWAAKISDFGLARVGPTNQPSTYVNTSVKGSFGYIDPNYFATGKLTRKSDVYAFGVVLFEVLCQKRPLDESFECGLATWVKESIKEGSLKQIVYSGIRNEIPPKCLKEFARIGERCLDSHPNQRPTMSEVVFSLESLLAQSVSSSQQKTSNSLQTPGNHLSLKALRAVTRKRLKNGNVSEPMSFSAKEKFGLLGERQRAFGYGK